MSAGELVFGTTVPRGMEGWINVKLVPNELFIVEFWEGVM